MDEELQHEACSLQQVADSISLLVKAKLQVDELGQPINARHYTSKRIAKAEVDL